ncbi:putative Transcriptional regulator RpiR family [Vibrio nigripulchritudo SFn27]|uniref:Putative Transcriptional regulator RpiR family n=1 Tax=Vibrio nigripulchritudo TaxID=28173 RepID=U4KD80_9VIBR|nr:MurR/RpiR family transcriptional regulator [Vibrio nigripulchritudo]CCN84877.1 putative Transcriptional regulator RpiR family [Vibrio nigripulchritudo BLFn1]CCN90088.1 putative Transcriptional regulator RpiR family [Vibrio nigripulchritudo SFn27]CCN94299.1 putative Transcriptional regulator RpiR family [Vibrio nigripulchritudo ENn2]CCO42653.1 putative Transcriptional regulator RpiR family [Vibrio nigripulchritudo SFn135]CCO51243.1 putative Transcriptional regulator RpiR family [Vibrio nigri
MSDLIPRLEMLSVHGSEAEKKISGFLLNDKTNNISTLSAVALGNQCGVSNASVIRFAQSLGYKGYSEFKLEYLAAQKHSAGEVLYNDVRSDDSPSEIIQKAGYLFSKNVENSIKVVDPEALERLANLMVKADKIALFGVGSSGVVASDAYQKLIRINKNVLFNSDTHVQRAYASMLTEKDLALAFTTRGQTKEVIQSLEIAQEGGCQISAITRYGKTPTSKLADLSLSFAYEERHHELGMITPQLSQMMLFDILYFRITALMGDTATSSLERIRSNFSNLVSK